MKRNLTIALVLIAVSALVLIFNAGDSVKVNLGFTSVKMICSVAFLLFIGVGVAIGMLLK